MVTDVLLVSLVLLRLVVTDVLLGSLVLVRVVLLVSLELVSVDVLRRVQNKDAATHHVVRWSRILWSRMFDGLTGATETCGHGCDAGLTGAGPVGTTREKTRTRHHQHSV